MSRPSGSASTTPVPPPPGRRPQTAQFPGLPSLLRNPTQTGTAAASSSSAPRPASALPSYIRSEASQLSSSPSSLGKGTPAVGPKEKLSLPGRTSKTGAKLVFLPEDVQSKPIPSHPSQLNVASAVAPPKAGERREDEENRGDDRSEAERMSKEEREREGFGRLTAYATADSYRLKSLAKFLGREHGAEVRIFDEAVYAVYTLPLLPGYGANVQIRSSVAVKSPGGGSILHAMDQAEETGYLDSYFALDETVTPPATENHDEPSTSPPVDRRPVPRTRTVSTGKSREPKLAEAIFFDYGVSVFFGFTEEQELTVLNDCSENGLWIEEKKRSAWETEECHFIYDPSAQYPRIFNDLFTFKSPSHLLKLSLSHAIAQSTKLSVYESAVQDTLADTSYIPKELALTGELELDRREAVKLTGRLFRLRVEVNLVSNVLDTPELFWSEASLKLLYDAVREYLEIDGRVHVLNEKLGVAGDLLEIIHEHVDNAGMHRVTWIIIWLIVVACLVEFGEVIARLVFHSVQPEAKARGKSALLTLMQNTSSKLLPIP